MNLGDGLLFELENGKPRLILLAHAGVGKNPSKLPSKHRAANILSAKQPSCVEEVQREEVQPKERPPQRSQREARLKAGRPALSCSSSVTTSDGRATVLPSSKAQGHHAERGSRAAAKVKTNKHKISTGVGPQGGSGRAGPPPNPEDGGGRRAGQKLVLTGVDASLKDGVVCLTREQLRQILSSIQTAGHGQPGPQEQTAQGGQPDTDPDSSVNGGEEREVKEDDKGEAEGRADDACGRLPRSSFTWLQELQSDSRAALNAKKAQWKRELDEQVALKQQQQQHSAPSRLQGEEYAESTSSVGHREPPAAIRSSLRLGEVAPMEEALGAERKEQQRRRWLEELDRQREETAERRKREKALRRQTEDHELWAAHFDSLQRRAPAPSAPPPGRLSGSEREDWEPSSSLSLAWEAASSCGAESVLGASVDSTRGHTARTSYLRTMTSLLDPAQIEERERRRLKQLEQQRAIEAQMEERKKQKEEEEAKRRREEEEEEKRVAQEREKLQQQYELELLKRKEKVEPPEESIGDGEPEETPESITVTRRTRCPENGSSLSSLYKDTFVQTEDTPPPPPPPACPPTAERLQTADVSAQSHPPPPGSAEPPNGRRRTARAGKENICLPTGEDPYEPFARTKTKRRPEWNTQRPSRRFVPASERYPVALQKNRQESRLRRQAELLALQERTRLPRTEPPPQLQETRLGPDGQQRSTSPVKKEESGSRGRSDRQTATSADRGRSPPAPAIRPAVRTQQASSSPPPALEFIPYLRTDEVFSLDPLEPAATPPPKTHSGPPPEGSAPPPVPSHRDPLLHPEMMRSSQRQQDILRGLAQLRQGLLRKQRELETDLNPLRSRHDNEQRGAPAARRT
ncbi:coiled-coil domain-containing protein 66-like isoform X3 [Fundulus heteroclitus]|uniref:coiled-coil domain-containing protein 66-like isoform X3 n=1 Tax=Fundulus heteroclitus TaxID=8078 RepID=UPI00165CA04E|nr:coiled-coil domain-containing protein 66-like isoform X3 [Fundulus heteroclitus]